MIERMSVMNRNRKLNRISKTVISGLLVTSLVVSNGAYANAQKISKDESVYVTGNVYTVCHGNRNHSSR